MNLASFQFALFLAIVALAGYVFRSHFRVRKTLLLVASYCFYAFWDWKFILVLLWITIVNFACGLWIERAEDRRVARYGLLVGVTASLGTLGYFKYFEFFVESLVSLIRSLGLQANAPMLEVMLPVGISFYTFQAISYTFDVYRGRERACTSFLDFALFVGFFPTLLSGPITRASTLLSQFRKPVPLVNVDANHGLMLLARGFLKKAVVADTLAMQLVDPVFLNPGSYSSSHLLIALYAYTFQVYMDLSGYTDMARGGAQVLGFHVPENFDRPYLAASLSNFWQRWHISMSSFFRDYLYFSLGGSRFGNVYRNLILTFVAIGFWHGAGWNFIVYGLVHGGVVALERWRRLRRRARGISEAAAVLSTRWFIGVLVTFHVVVGSRVLFRADDLGAAFAYIRALFSGQSTSPEISALGVAVLAAAAVLHLLPRRFCDYVLIRATYLHPLAQSAALVFIVLFVGAFSTGGAPFLYFQF